MRGHVDFAKVNNIRFIKISALTWLSEMNPLENTLSGHAR